MYVGILHMNFVYMFFSMFNQIDFFQSNLLQWLSFHGTEFIYIFSITQACG